MEQCSPGYSREEEQCDGDAITAARAVCEDFLDRKGPFKVCD